MGSAVGLVLVAMTGLRPMQVLLMSSCPRVVTAQSSSPSRFVMMGSQTACHGTSLQLFLALLHLLYLSSSNHRKKYDKAIYNHGKTSSQKAQPRQNGPYN